MGFLFGRGRRAASSDPSGQTTSADRVLALGAAELVRLLTPERCLAALEDAYRGLHASPEDRGSALGFVTHVGKIHVKAGLTPHNHAYFAAKVNANYPDNSAKFGLPTIQGLIVLVACDTGRPVAILQSGVLTGLRTAAATALAIKHGAKAHTRTLAMIGCGEQARYQLDAIRNVRSIGAVVAFDRDRASADTFAEWARQMFPVETTIAPDIPAALVAADIAVTCTTARRFIISADMVRPGCFIAAVGADNPDKQEIDPALFGRARVIVDDVEQCAASGDLAHALKAGTIARENVTATLAQLAAGAARARTGEDDIVIFDSTGMGIQDVAASAASYEAALARRTGISVDLS